MVNEIRMRIDMRVREPLGHKVGCVMASSHLFKSLPGWL